MKRDAEALLSEALALPDDQRARLARALIDSLEFDEEPEGSAGEIEAASRTEVERREQELNDDPTLAVPADLVFAEAERRLEEIRTKRESGRRPA